MYGDTIGTSRMRGFTHNADDRMIRIDMLEGIESVSQFEYDAMGRRLISTDNDGNQTLYYYDGIRVILEKIKPSGSGTWSTSQVYTLQDGAIGFIISSRDTATGDDTWYHYDRLGTVMNLTDATGAVTATYSQDAFGNVLSGSTDGFHLTTKRHYSAIGLYYFYQRWYDPELGIFNTRTIFSPLQEHPYLMCESNPVSYFDSTGLIKLGEFLKCWPSCLPDGKKDNCCRCVFKNQGLNPNDCNTSSIKRRKPRPPRRPDSGSVIPGREDWMDTIADMATHGMLNEIDRLNNERMTGFEDVYNDRLGEVHGTDPTREGGQQGHIYYPPEPIFCP